ncbi:MAG: sulfatase-like hydrolase/transferase [Planctomycetota bacterium]
MLRPLLPLLTLLLAALPVAPARQVAAPDRPPLSLLVVVLDDASWEELYGLELPTIQGLLPAARRYTQFYSSSNCSPSRYQLHFGRYPHRIHLGKAINVSADEGAPTSDLSIAELLATRGYRTALIGKWHVNGAALPANLSELPRIHGYQEWLAGSPGNITSGGSHYNWQRFDNGVKSQESTYTTHAIGDAFIEWWSTTDGPKYASVCFMAPHEPHDYAPPDLAPGSTGGGGPGPGGLFDQRNRYESQLIGIDTKLAQMLSVIDLSQTVVLLMSDNGTPPDVPPPGALLNGYKLSQWQGGINVPLLVWGPGVAPGVDGSLVQIVDIPATLAELAGATDYVGLADSIPFTATLTGGGGSRPAAFVHRFSPNGAGLALTGHEWALIRQDGWKLLAEGPQLSLGATPQLFNLALDPTEQSPRLDPRLTAELLAIRDRILGPDWP